MPDTWPLLRALARPHGPRARLRVWERWHGAPMSEVEPLLPREGTIADVGCGFGLFAALLALRAPARSVWGVDVDAKKVRAANTIFGGLPGVHFVEGDLAEADLPPCDAAVLFDVLHHLRDDVVDRVLLTLHARLRPGGLLVVKENDTEPFAKRAIAMGIEHVALGLSLTASAPVRFRSRAEWTAALEGAGFRVLRAEHLRTRRGFFVPHALLVAER